MSDLALQLARRFRPRDIAIVLALVLATFAFLDLVYRHALDSLIAFKLEDSDAGLRNSLPAVVTGFLLVAAAALAFAIARLRPASAAWWRAAGIVLVLLGVDTAVGVHVWLESQAGLSWNIAYLPLLAAAAIVFFEAARLMAPDSLARLWFSLGAAAWLAAGLIDASRSAGEVASPAGVLLAMAAASALLVGVARYAHVLSLASDPPGTRRELDLSIARAAVSRIDVRSLALGLAVLVVVFGILGAIAYPGGGGLRVFDLNKEQTFPATFSGVLLLGAGALALLNGVVRCPDRRDRRWWLILAAVFAFLGIDEIAALHEAVQDRVNVWGQATLTPIVIAGLASWWIVLQRLRPQPGAARLFVLGAVAWAGSQGIDLLFNEHFGWTIVPEELIEMAGSALFGFALLVAVKELVGRTAPVSPPAAAPAPARLEELTAAH